MLNGAFLKQIFNLDIPGKLPQVHAYHVKNFPFVFPFLLQLNLFSFKNLYFSWNSTGKSTTALKNVFP